MKSLQLTFVLLSIFLLSAHAVRFYSRQDCNYALRLRNGRVSCNPQNANFTSCTFTCNDDYSLIGRSRLTCRLDSYFGGGSLSVYLWSSRPPYCRLHSRCPLHEYAPNADLYCTGNNPGDYCRYACFNGYQAHPSDLIYQDCLHNGYWSNPPCCARQNHCYSNQKADIVIALDSSFKFGSSRWLRVKRFIRNFIDLFSTETNMTRFSIFRYDRTVDTANSILLNEAVDDRIHLLETYDTMPNQVRTGHHVNAALRYISQTVLTENNGDRPDVKDIILLVTKDHSEETEDLELPDFDTQHPPKVIVLAMDVGDVPMLHQVQLNQGNQYLGDPREYWKVISKNMDNIYMAETQELSGLSIALQRDLGPYVCLIEGCKDHSYS